MGESHGIIVGGGLLDAGCVGEAEGLIEEAERVGKGLTPYGKTKSAADSSSADDDDEDWREEEIPPPLGKIESPADRRGDDDDSGVGGGT